MDIPHGRCIGNSLEILECAMILQKPEKIPEDMKELVLKLGTTGGNTNLPSILLTFSFNH